MDRSSRDLSRYSATGESIQKWQKAVSELAWQGYLKNCGNWIGKRALSNNRGRVLIDIPSRVVTERFRTAGGEDVVLWRTSVRTAEGIDEAEEEWSREELADFGALVADGSFSIGAETFQGEPITVDQCVLEDNIRVRTTHAFDWEGCLSGIVASRERMLPGKNEELLDEKGRKRKTTSAEQHGLGFVEPAPWRSPRVLLDYMLGVWEGRGVSIDSLTGETHNLSSRLRLNQDSDGKIAESSVLRVVGGGPTRVFDARAQVDENLLVYGEANLHVFLLPGGISMSAPVRIRNGRPFSLETAFLMRPDCRKRVIRLYNKDCDWVNTVFINERRVG